MRNFNNWLDTFIAEINTSSVLEPQVASNRNLKQGTLKE